ncbi:hypothetical protein F8M41_006412 [Gigaspora margarita]|uniref:Uncharacterized protein n=1 Tax=Gigaspora margarita TaxID=4874 RepID=A0A8H4AWR3_GIGMA|nr:hypothetical protein F8M41_006412 [Gigaspora margarita]
MLNNELEYSFESYIGQSDSNEPPSFFDPYAHIYGEDVFLALLGLSFLASQQFNTNEQSEEPTQVIQEQQHNNQGSIQLIQEQQHDEQEPSQLADEQESDKEPDYCDKNYGDIIKIDASFPS